VPGIESAWQIQVVVEPERLVAEVSYRGELWAALVQENGAVRLHTYPRSAPRRDSDEWNLDYGEALEHLTDAHARLKADFR
jgi:hypothetical protein